MKLSEVIEEQFFLARAKTFDVGGVEFIFGLGETQYFSILGLIFKFLLIEKAFEVEYIGQFGIAFFEVLKGNEGVPIGVHKGDDIADVLTVRDRLFSRESIPDPAGLIDDLLNVLGSYDAVGSKHLVREEASLLGLTPTHHSQILHPLLKVNPALHLVVDRLKHPQGQVLLQP
jgi:hypothetical protein